MISTATEKHFSTSHILKGACIWSTFYQYQQNNKVTTFSRHAIATLHFNENIKRKTMTSKTGEEYIKVSYPKYRLGEEIVRQIPVVPTYGEYAKLFVQKAKSFIFFILYGIYHIYFKGYVQGIMNLLLSATAEELSAVSEEHEKKHPGSLVEQFQNRKRKSEAVQKNKERNTKQVTIFK